ITKVQQLEQKIRTKIYSQGLIAKHNFSDIVGKSENMLQVVNKALKFAETDSTILLLGESGTGKEMFAQSIHNASSRRKGPFVAINCAALPENLLESELFGYEEGAFTGARKGGKQGLFELAHRGTIFLDEIGSINLALQGRLLRVLQEREVMRVGGNQVIPVDIRIIAATNEDLGERVTFGQFRNDLFYRLNVLKLLLPALRERTGDPELLLEYFINSCNQKFGKKVVVTNKDLFNWANSYYWPGNIRQLENFVERLIILAELESQNSEIIYQLIYETESEIGKCCSPKFTDKPYNKDTITVEVASLAEMEDQLIRKIADTKGFSKEELAKLLEVSRTTLWKKLKKEG
ncbi:MAG: sigma 54-interacting transcriptional regulator, partial [Bacillota bacterium]|nr:sigma 54-interacting transcriptional regulator [Bacillota bacterium]